MSPALPEFLDLSFREDLDLLFSRWLRPTNDAEVQQGYDAALTMAVPRRARYWLLDIRRRGLSSPAAMQWVMGTFLPQLVACMGAKVYLAYLLSPSHLLDAPPVETYAPQVSSRCDIRMFSDEGSALQWLSACHQAENAAAVQQQAVGSAG